MRKPRKYFSNTVESTIKDEELHTELLDAFNVYFEANQRWHSRNTRRAALDTKAALSKIRDICITRKKAIAVWQKEKNEQLRKRHEANPSRKGKNQYGPGPGVTGDI